MLPALETSVPETISDEWQTKKPKPRKSGKSNIWGRGSIYPLSSSAASLSYGSMAQPEQLDWAHHLGSPFALAVAPFLYNRELFALSACSHKLLRLRCDLCSWDVKLDYNSFESFRTQRHSVPPCFEEVESFDLASNRVHALSRCTSLLDS
ncbi:hypothetical protein B484DRAFT_200483 [Ochromonadaceae sp. CCMP2298]|nr:hypothetical protein B484DRAFT_200483 [Ochromonadaceae sp. CCMP2298]